LASIENKEAKDFGYFIVHVFTFIVYCFYAFTCIIFAFSPQKRENTPCRAEMEGESISFSDEKVMLRWQGDD